VSAQTITGLLAAMSERNHAEAKRVHALIRRVAPTLKPGVMGGMLGYGRFHYRYPTGREGDTALLLLADRVDGLSLYVNCVAGDRYLAEKYAKRLGKVSVGKSCIRFKKLDDVDEAALAALIREATAIGGASKT
jgi:hypothetical protein